MQLRIYLAKYNILVKDFAKKIKVDRAYLSRIKNGRARPSERLAEDIEQATNGEVTVKDLLGNN